MNKNEILDYLKMRKENGLSNENLFAMCQLAGFMLGTSADEVYNSLEIE